VLVHVGFAIATIAEQAALETYAALADLGALELPGDDDAAR
jgi:hydrogenase maturation factor